MQALTVNKHEVHVPHPQPLGGCIGKAPSLRFLLMRFTLNINFTNKVERV